MIRVLKTRLVVLVVCSLVCVLGSLSPCLASARGTVQEFPYPHPFFDGVVDHEGNLWFTWSTYSSYVVRVTPQGDITPFFLGFERDFGPIVLGPDGNIWFISRFFSIIYRITPSGILTTFSSTSGVLGFGEYNDIIVGKDGNLWVSRGGGRDYLLRITPQGDVTPFPLPVLRYSVLNKIAAATDGSIWFPEEGRNIIGKLDTEGVIHEYPAASSVQDIAPAPDGGMWFRGTASTEISQITSSGTISSVTVENVTNMVPDGKEGVWFTGATTTLGHLSHTGKVSVYAVPSSTSLTPDRDGGVWFTEATNELGHLNPGGKLEELTIPHVAQHIVIDCDGETLWLSEQNATIGRLTL